MLQRFLVGLGMCLAWSGWATASEVTAEKTDRGVTIKADGKLFAEYLKVSGLKPIVWPIIGPSGVEMTRAYPMGPSLVKKPDHPHHRSLWFTHGNVNGIDFWKEVGSTAQIRHRDYIEVRGGKEAVVATRNDWVSPEGKKVLEDETRFGFVATAEHRWIDVAIRLIASEGPVVFGDTKEGSFGVRVPEWMSVDAKQGGRIVNSEGQTDKDAWGRTAAWVDYYGPVEGKGEVVGVAVLNHPTSFRYPTHWHVRTYGLFAANPFGLKDFPDGKDKDGSFTLERDKSIELKYRVLLHRGDEKAGKVAEMFAKYAK